MRWLCNEKQFELSDSHLICQLYEAYWYNIYHCSSKTKNWQYLELLKELYDKFNHSKTISSRISFSTSCSHCKRKNVIKLFEKLGFRVIKYNKIYGKIKVTIVPL